jgi:signal transduction histidine kinase
MPYSIIKESLNPVIDNLPDGILVTDMSGMITLYNRKAAVFLGIKGNTALNQPVKDRITNNILVGLITKVLNLNVPYYTEDICLIDTDRAKLSVRISPVRDSDGLLIGSVTLLHDVGQISDIDKIKSNFLPMVSHQLKSPLSSTLLQTSILLDGIVGELNEQQKDLLRKIKAKIKGMNALVNDVLDVNFIEEGGHVSQIEHLNFSEIIERSIDLLQPQAEDKNISLQVTVDDQFPLIDGNKSSIEALFINLISNAIKFTPSDGLISITLKKHSKEIEIKVSDTGIGIEDKDLNHLFEKFYRERSERTKYISGTGLGLSIVKGVVDAYHGSIYVESEVGKGTTFRIFLPI